MTELKFTDGEIIELLRAYVERMCGKCNVKDLGTCCGSCFITAISQGADLIYRQKVEIESLKADIDSTCVILEEQHKERTQEHENQMEMLNQIKEQIPLAMARKRNRAIEEFVERVKSYIDVGHLRPPTEVCFSELDVVRMIEKIAQEL